MNNSTEVLAENSTSHILTELSMGTMPLQLIIFIVLQQLVFLLGCCGNLLVIIIFMKYLKMSNNLNIICFHMALSDFVQALASGGQVLYFFFLSLNSNMYTCFLRYRLVSFPVISSQFLVTMATCDRFVAVNFPHLYCKTMTKKAAYGMVISAYVLSLALNTPPFLGWNNWKNGSRGCVYEFIFTGPDMLIGSSLMFTFMISSMTLYTFILRVAFKYHRRQTLKSEDKANNSRLRKSIRNARFLGIITLVFTMSWAPSNVYQFKYGLGYHGDFDFGLGNWCVFLGIARCITNPFIYMWHRRDFNRSTKKLLCCISSTNARNVSTRTISEGVP